MKDAITGTVLEFRRRVRPVMEESRRACILLAQVEPGRELPKGFASRVAMPWVSSSGG